MEVLARIYVVHAKLSRADTDIQHIQASLHFLRTAVCFTLEHAES